VYRALVLGVRDYVTKHDFPASSWGSRAHRLGAELAIAVDAIGARARARVMMPSRYTAP